MFCLVQTKEQESIRSCSFVKTFKPQRYRSQSVQSMQEQILSATVKKCVHCCMCARRPTLNVAKAVKVCEVCLCFGPVAYFLPLRITREVFVPTVNHLPNPGQDVSRQACILKPEPHSDCAAALLCSKGSLTYTAALWWLKSAIIEAHCVNIQ